MIEKIPAQFFIDHCNKKEIDFIKLVNERLKAMKLVSRGKRKWK